MKTRSTDRRLRIVAVLSAVAMLFVFALTGCRPKRPVDTDDGVSYTVTFDSNGGSAVKSQVVQAGGKAMRPTAPTKAGHTFVDWYADKETLSDVWGFETRTVNSDITLYAKWTNGATEIFTVTFDTDGGSSVDSQRIEKGGKATRPSDPQKNGYVFDGWYTDGSFGTQWNFGSMTIAKDTVIYAKWKDGGNQGEPPENGKVTATFNVGLDARRKGLSNPPAQTVDKGKSITAPNVSLSGYRLSGWYAEDGNTAWDFASGKLDTDTTFFARWTEGGDVGGYEYDPPIGMRDDSTLYIHYLRSAGDYSGWAVWAWTTGGGIRFTSAGRDEAGIALAIDLDALGSPSTVNFKIAIIEEGGYDYVWGASDGGDNSVRLSDTMRVGGSYHWFVKEFYTDSGSNRFSPEGGDDSAMTEPLRANISDVDRTFAAGLDKFKTADDIDEMGVGYQIFVASFCDSDGDGVGDLQGIIKQLPYLDALNVDVLWLTPIQSSNSMHGYDCYDYYAIDPKFGTNADYRELVYKAHSRGIKVIMDLVVNHTSPQNEWFIKSRRGVIEDVTYQDGTKETVRYRDFYRWKNSGVSSSNRWHSTGDGWYFYSSFGSNMPELNYDCQAVRDAMADVAAYWMNYGLDGFRMDAIKHVFMWDESENKSGDVEGGSYDKPYNYNLTKNVEFFKEFNYKLKSKWPHCFLLGEQLSGNVGDVSKFYAGMDSLFDFNTYYDLPNKMVFGDVSSVASTFNSNAAQYERERGDRPVNSMISSNHDIPRLSRACGDDEDYMKLYFAVTMTLPGLSWIYYGDEIGLIGYKPSGNSPDDCFRQSMKWNSTWQYKCTAMRDFMFNEGTASVEEQLSDANSLLSYVQGLTKLRNDHPVLINGKATCLVENGMLKIVVTDGRSTVTSYHNFSYEQKTVSASGAPVFGSSTVPSHGSVAFAS